MTYSGVVATWLLANGSAPVYITVDDGYFYFKIAQNIAQGAGSTFDGLHPTNGYHPLWLLILVPIFWLTTDVGLAHVLGYLLQAVFMAAGTGLLYYTARLEFGRLASSLAALLWIGLTYWLNLSGLEFSLHALGVLASVYVYLRWFAEGLPQSSRPYWLLGLLLGLTFLARLETLLLAGCVALFIAIREAKRGSSRAAVKRLLALGMPVLVLGLLYAGANQTLFGHLWPVSSLVKRDWSAYYLSQDPLYQSAGWLAAKTHHLLWPLRSPRGWYSAFLALGVFGAGSLWLATSRKPCGLPGHSWLRDVVRPWRPFILYGLLSFTSYALFYHSTLSSTPWYYVVQVWLGIMLFSATADQVPQAEWSTSQLGMMRWGRRAVLVGAVLLVGFVPLRTLQSLEQWRPAVNGGVDPVLQAMSELPADALLGSWNGGSLSYLSGRQIVNLDGLVNSWDYRQNQRHDLCRYWQRTGIRYLVDVFDRDQNGFPTPKFPAVPAYQSYHECADHLELIWADERYDLSSFRVEIYRIGNYSAAQAG